MANFDERLIAVISQYPAVWDRRSYLFKDKNIRENAWRKVAGELKGSVEVVSKRFTSLREKYRKEKQKFDLATRSGAGALEFERWPLMASMSFLDAVQTKRTLTSNLVAAVTHPALAEEMEDDPPTQETDYPPSPTASILREYLVDEPQPGPSGIQLASLIPITSRFIPLGISPVPGTGKPSSPVPSTSRFIPPGISPVPGIDNSAPQKRKRKGETPKEPLAVDVVLSRLTAIAEMQGRYAHFGAFIAESLPHMTAENAKRCMHTCMTSVLENLPDDHNPP